MWARNRNSGFTIVELLIVIVVIAILAAISVVAYNGIQQRARNSQAVSIIQAYRKALTAYAIEHQYYPTLSSACLGDDYPDAGVYATLSTRNCFRSNSTAGVIGTGFNNEIKPYLSGKIPTPNNVILGSGSSPWSTRGAVFLNTSGVILNGVPNPWVMIYTLEGQTQCPVGPVLDLSTYPNVTSTPPGSGYSVLLSGGTVGVECWVAMPDPARS